MRSWVIVIALAAGLAGCASALKDLNKPAPVVSSTTLTSAQADLNRPQPTPGSSTLNAAELNKPAAKPKVSIPKPEAIAKDLPVDSEKWGRLLDSLLRYFDGSLTLLEIAERHDLPFERVHSYVRRFEGRGHVRRVPNPDDGRSYRLELTRTGRAAHRAAGALFLPVLEEVEGRLGRSLSMVRGSLSRTRGALTDD